MARSCIRNPSATPASALRASALSIACGSPETLPEVITRMPEQVQEQVMQRRVRNHHAQRGRGRVRPPRAASGARLPARSARRGLSAARVRPADPGDRGQPVHGAISAAACRPPLSCAEPRQRRGVGGVAGQVKAAQPLQRQDTARAQSAVAAAMGAVMGAAASSMPSRSNHRRGPQSGQAMGWA